MTKFYCRLLLSLICTIHVASYSMYNNSAKDITTKKVSFIARTFATCPLLELLEFLGLAETCPTFDDILIDRHNGPHDTYCQIVRKASQGEPAYLDQKFIACLVKRGEPISKENAHSSIFTALISAGYNSDEIKKILDAENIILQESYKVINQNH